MSLAISRYQPGTRTISDTYEIDAEVSSEHTFDSEVTEHPVEKGADVADHIRARPIAVTIEGVVSDDPLGNFITKRQGDALPSAEAFARLQEIRDAREPVQITTSLRVYDDMILESFAVPRDAATGHALRFRAVFRQIVLITNSRVTIRTAAPSGKGKVQRGNKAATPVAVTPAKAPAVDLTRPPVRQVKVVSTVSGGKTVTPPGAINIYDIGGGHGPGRF